MPIRHSLWHVGPTPRPLSEASLATEALLETMIVAAPDMLSADWMLVGRQEDTGYGGRIDLLALAPDGALILIELKRGRTPREVVAQAIDYATWLERLEAQDVVRIYTHFSKGGDLGEAFRTRFGHDIGELAPKDNHQIVIVAASLDASSERIVNYLNDRGIAINVLCFQVFETGAGQLLSRAWLLDPVETQVAATVNAPTRIHEPWNGEWYVSYGHGDARSWDEAVRYGFICAGGGAWYSNTLNLLKAGDRIWVKAPGHGFVGVGRVTGSPVAAADFRLPGPDGQLAPALQLLHQGGYHKDHVDDPSKTEYFVLVDWLDTVPLDKAIDELGLFGNQNTVCAPKTPKWRHTVDRLKQLMPGYESAGPPS